MKLVVTKYSDRVLFSVISKKDLNNNKLCFFAVNVIVITDVLKPVFSRIRCNIDVNITSGVIK